MQPTSKLKAFFSNYKYTYLFAIVLALTIYIGLDRYQFIYPLIDGALVVLLFALCAKLKKPYAYILAFLLAFIIAADCAFIIHFNTTIGIGNIASAFETNAAEAAGFMQGRVLLIWLCCFVTCLFFSWLMINELGRTSVSKKIIALLVVVLLSTTTGHMVWKIYQKNEFYDVTTKGLIKDRPVTQTLALLSYRLPVVIPTISSLGMYAKDRYDFEKGKNKNKTIPAGLHYNPSRTTPLKIYFVIGESSFRGHFSLYGYPIKTTPFLDSLATDTCRFTYYNAISPASVTRDALRFAFSFATPTNKDAFFDKKNIVGMAQSSGYQTIWITNQYSNGSMEYYPQYVAKMADQFYNASDMGNGKLDDFNLLKLLKQKTTPLQKQFIALHQIGSHGPYDEFDEIDSQYFQANNIPQNEYSSYDKTIYHLDRFLRELTKYTMETDPNSIIIYFSDHGELVNVGQGIMGAGNDQFKIPLFFINNNTTIPVKKIVDKYVDKDNGLINSVNLPYMLSEMMGYDIDPQEVQKAIADGKYILQTDGNPTLFDNL